MTEKLKSNKLIQIKSIHVLMISAIYRVVQKGKPTFGGRFRILPGLIYFLMYIIVYENIYIYFYISGEKIVKKKMQEKSRPRLFEQIGRTFSLSKDIG